MRRKLKISDIFIPKKIMVGDKDIPPMSCSNNGIFPRELKFKKKLSKSLSKNKVASKGDFVFGLSRQILNFGMMQYDMGCFSSAYKIYECKYSYEFSRFLELYIRENHNYFYQCIEGGAREGQTISEDILFSLEILVPNEDEIKAIVNLDEMFKKKLTSNMTINQTLEKIIKKLYRSWFIDFDPVKSKVEKVSSNFSKETDKLFPDSFVDSKMNKIPKGWRTGQLSDLISYISKGISPKYTDDQNFPVINQKCIRNGDINFELIKFTEFKKNLQENFLNPFDVVVNSMGEGTLGRVSIFIDYIKKVVVDGCITVVRGKNKATSLFLYQNLSQREDEIINLSKGSTGQTTLKKEDLVNLKLVIPEAKIIENFANISQNLYLKKYQNNMEIKYFCKLREKLFKKLISDELTIVKSEKFIDKGVIQ